MKNPIPILNLYNSVVQSKKAVSANLQVNRYSLLALQTRADISRKTYFIKVHLDVTPLNFVILKDMKFLEVIHSIMFKRHIWV